MSTETNFNAAPFWDDYDEEKGYYRILFRPSMPVQARELTQSQTILQNQIERFGRNIFKDGTIIKGCSFIFDGAIDYVKVLDLQVDGQPVNASQFANTLVRNSANLSAVVIDTKDGLESQNPDLNTLYVKYQNAGSDNSRIFSPEDVISAYDRDFSIQRVEINDGGTGYSNNDSVVFTPSGASARLITDNLGTIQEVVVTSGGSDYTTTPTVAIANSAGGTANGTGASVVANTIIAQLTIAANTFASGNTVAYSPVGRGYSFRVNEGEIFQKGFFIRVEPQSVIVSKYTVAPDDLSVGFITRESVVNNNVDSSLLDNAQGVSNFSGPGAFRLKLTPELAVLSSEDAASSNTFFSLVDFENGRPIRIRQSSEYNVLGQEMARRTVEESGNYVVKQFPIFTDEIYANTTHFQARVGAGLAYVNGYRVEQLDTGSVGVRKGTDVVEAKSTSTSINYANYIEIQNMNGILPFNTTPAVSLRSAVSTGVASGAGTELGTARIRGLVYDRGTPGEPTAVYRLYIYDIRLVGGASFKDVKSVFYDGGGSPNNGASDIVLNASSAAEIFEPSFNGAIFKLGRKALKTIRNLTANNNTNYIYTSVDQGVSFSTSGSLQKNLTGSDTFPYSGTLNDTEERDFIFIARNAANASANGTGTVAVTSGANTVVGTGTSFLADYIIGDHVVFGTAEVRRIVNIANNTYMQVDSDLTSANASTIHKTTFPANVPIAFTGHPIRTIAVTGAGSTLTANLGINISNSLNVSAIYNVKRSNALQLTKNYNASVVVKIATNTAPNGASGPWCLGVPDAISISRVMKTTNGDYTTGAVDVTSHFSIDSGQKETHYGLAYLRKKPTSTLSIGAADYLTVTFSAFTHTNTGGGLGFFTVDSYPVDDSSSANVSTTIKTQNIPVFVSPTSGYGYDLRDSVDLRPIVSNTVVLTSNTALANVNPSSTETYTAVEKNFPAPNKIFTSDFQYYLGRYDKLALNSLGQFTIVEGSASEIPYPPSDVDGAMTLATVAVPPYPTLTTMSNSGRPDYTVKVTAKQTRRYTMADISKIDNRLQRVEYYTALNLLEKQTKDLIIPSSVDASMDRFKNGIFVDPFADFSISNVIDGEFTASIDEAAGELVPRFEQGKFDLKLSNTSGVVQTGDLVTLNYSETPLFGQAYASRVRNCVENYWSFTGKMVLTPSYDNYFETRTSPQNVMNIEIDNAATTLALVEQLNSIRAVNQPAPTATTTSSNNLVSSSTTTADDGSIWRDETYETIQSTITTQTRDMLNATISETSQQVGDFITDISFAPFIREQVVYIRAYGLKPRSQLWAFFDKVNVTAFCQPATFDATLSPSGTDTRAWMPYGRIGQGLVANDTGEVYGLLYIPADTFFVGDRELKLLDVDNLVSESAATTSTSVMFHAYNYAVSKSALTVSTRAADIDLTSSTTSSTTTTRSSSNLSTMVQGPPAPVVQAPEPLPDPGPAIDFAEPDASWWWWDDIFRNIASVDPIAQTFSVTSDHTRGQEGLFITSLDVFFQRKDPIMGVTVELRLTENGYPSKIVVPFGRKHLTSSQINVSETAATATNVLFDSPIFLKAGQEYAFVIIPDGNSPEYLIWCAQVGGTDITNTSLQIRSDWGEGVLFTSTNNSAWQSVQNEDLKFRLYRAEFSTSAGTLTIANKSEELLSGTILQTTTPSASANTRSRNRSGFAQGELAFNYSNTYVLTGSVSFTSNSSVVTGTGTNFLTSLSAGKYVTLSNNATLTSNVLATSTWFDVFEVQAVTNNTSFVIRGQPKFSATGVKALQAPVGKVFLNDELQSKVHLTDSTTANSTHKFTVGETLVGSLTGTVMLIDSIDDQTISHFQPLIYRTGVSGTSIAPSVSLYDSTFVSRGSYPIKFNDTNYITGFDAIVGSRTNEIAEGVNKTLSVDLALTTNNSIVSPCVDLQASSIIYYKNLINDDSTGEAGPSGDAISKYVSKTIVLADGQDSEDIKVYLTAYKPVGADIDVYVRLLNSEDPDNLRDKTWTKLSQLGDDVRSDTTNRNDFREFEYSFADIPSVTALTGVVSGTSGANSVSGVSTLFTTELTVGDVVSIPGAGDTYHVAKVTGITSNVAIQLSSNLPWTVGGSNAGKFVNNEEAFRDVTNLGTITYYNDSAKFQTYKTYAIKVVLRSSSVNSVPRCRDLRAVALSV